MFSYFAEKSEANNAVLYYSNQAYTLRCKQAIVVSSIHNVKFYRHYLLNLTVGIF